MGIQDVQLDAARGSSIAFSMDFHPQEEILPRRGLGWENPKSPSGGSRKKREKLEAARPGWGQRRGQGDNRGDKAEGERHLLVLSPLGTLGDTGGDKGTRMKVGGTSWS